MADESLVKIGTCKKGVHGNRQNWVYKKYAAVNGVDSSRTDAADLLLYDALLPYLTAFIFAGVSYTSFFIALYNMADKVPSFKEGGILWFTDLTTPDHMLGFPIIMAMTLLYDIKRIEKDVKEVNSPIWTLEYYNSHFYQSPSLCFSPRQFFVIGLPPGSFFCHLHL